MKHFFLTAVIFFLYLLSMGQSACNPTKAEIKIEGKIRYLDTVGINTIDTVLKFIRHGNHKEEAIFAYKCTLKFDKKGYLVTSTADLGDFHYKFYIYKREIIKALKFLNNGVEVCYYDKRLSHFFRCSDFQGIGLDLFSVWVRSYGRKSYHYP